MGTPSSIVVSVASLIVLFVAWVRRQWAHKDSGETELNKIREKLQKALAEGRVTDAAYLAQRLEQLQIKFNKRGDK